VLEAVEDRPHLLGGPERQGVLDHDDDVLGSRVVGVGQQPVAQLDPRAVAALPRADLGVEDLHQRAAQQARRVDVLAQVGGLPLVLPALAGHEDGTREAGDAHVGRVEDAANLSGVRQEDVGGGQQRLVEEAPYLDPVVPVLAGAGGDGLEVPGGATDGAEGESE
jgi:hypothetical protein